MSKKIFSFAVIMLLMIVPAYSVHDELLDDSEVSLNALTEDFGITPGSRLYILDLMSDDLIMDILSVIDLEAAIRYGMKVSEERTAEALYESYNLNADDLGVALRNRERTFLRMRKMVSKSGDIMAENDSLSHIDEVLAHQDVILAEAKESIRTRADFIKGSKSNFKTGGGAPQDEELLSSLSDENLKNIETGIETAINADSERRETAQKRLEEIKQEMVMKMDQEKTQSHRDGPSSNGMNVIG